MAKVYPYYAGIEFSAGCGSVGICSSAPSYEEAIEAAKEWHRKHPKVVLWYCSPACVIRVSEPYERPEREMAVEEAIP